MTRVATGAPRGALRHHEPDLSLERELVGPGQLLACVDEVGRGSLAGPVSVGLVIIDPHTGDSPPGIRDSKDLSAAARAGLVAAIRSWAASWAVGHAGAEEIDDHGIVPALRLAGHRAWTQALQRLTNERPANSPESKQREQTDIHTILLDGSHDWFTPQLLDALTHPAGEDLAEVTVPVTTRVKADRDCAGVGAASVLAKVERDGIMEGLDAAHPGFGWAKNKGYGTAGHRQAIAELGATELHRRSWNLGTPA